MPVPEPLFGIVPFGVVLFGVVLFGVVMLFGAQFPMLELAPMPVVPFVAVPFVVDDTHEPVLVVLLGVVLLVPLDVEVDGVVPVVALEPLFE